MPTIADVRQQYPQYHDLSDQQLADALYKKFYSDMPREQFDAKLGIAPVQPSQPMKPGTREYADWAAQQARAGKTLPRVSPPTPEEQALTNPMSQIAAGYSSAVDSVPFAGPTLTNWANQARSTVQTAMGNPMTPQDVSAESQKLQDANPVATVAGQFIGPTVALGPLAEWGPAARVMGMSGPLWQRILLGGASGGAIAAGDSAIRGGSTGENIDNGILGAGVGMAFPLIGKGISAGAARVLGKTVPKEMQVLGRAFQRDGIDPLQVNQKLADVGTDAMVMDLGPNLQRQAGAVASMPGEGQKVIRDAVEARGANATSRVQADTAATLGTGPELWQMQEQTIANMKAKAGPLYDAVRNTPVKMTPNINFVLQTHTGKAAYERAMALASNDGIVMGPFRPGDPLTVQILDYVKQGLDDIWVDNKGNNIGRQARNLANTLLKEVDGQVTGYKIARDTYAGEAAIKDALSEGATVFGKQMTPRQLDEALNNMNPSEKDAFIQAARTSIESMLGNATNDALSLRNFFKKDWNEQKLRLLIGDGPASQLMKRINREAKYGQTANVVAGNSETAARAAAQSDISAEVGNVPRPQGLVGLVLSAIDTARNKLAMRNNAAMTEKLAGLHTSTQFTRQQLEQLARAARPEARGWVAPAVPAVQQEQNGPLQITVFGGKR